MQSRGSGQTLRRNWQALAVAASRAACLSGAAHTKIGSVLGGRDGGDEDGRARGRRSGKRRQATHRREGLWSCRCSGALSMMSVITLCCGVAR